jgi:hypothetical protein
MRVAVVLTPGFELAEDEALRVVSLATQITEPGRPPAPPDLGTTPAAIVMQRD